ncbi:hypothetical protein BDZ97DRAFT_1928868 [Flammula alnicola]|nr:hypothetical protein BDZ97DRAFT_1928868 [Flammula alnicola]
MASTSDDHFELIRGHVKSTARAIFISHRASNTHPPAAEIRPVIDAIHGPLSKHLKRFPDDLLDCEALRAFITSLSVAAYQLDKRPPAWNEWLISRSATNFNPENHFFRSTCLSPDYEYSGTPVEDSDEAAEEVDASDAGSDGPPAPAPRFGPPAKRQRIDPPATSFRRQIISSPAPSISTRSHSQLKTAPSAPAPIPLKASAAPAAASVSSRTRRTSTRAVSPIAKVAPTTSKTRKAPSVYEVTDEEEVDELEDDPEPAPKASSSKGKGKAKTTTKKLLPREVAAIGLLSQPGPSHEEAISPDMVTFTMEERQQNPGRCLACATHLFKGEPRQCKFLGWGRRCGSCKSGGKSRCTFELKPEELDEVLQSLTPLVSSSRADLHALIVSIERYLQDATMFSQLADRANRHASGLIMQLLERAQYLKKNFPPGHLLGPRFENMDILDALLACNTTIPSAYLDDSATAQELFPPLSLIEAFFTHPDNDDLTGQAVDAAHAAVKAFHAARPPVASPSRAGTSARSPSRIAASPGLVDSQLPDAEPRDQDGDHEDHPNEMETDDQ